MSGRVWDKPSASSLYRGRTDRIIHILSLKKKSGVAATRQRFLKEGMTIAEYIQAVMKDAERLARRDIPTEYPAS
jgi:hypothetical protein